MAQTTEFKIEGMDCAHCVESVTKAVNGLPGIENVTVSLASNSATVTRDTALVSDAAIIEAIEDAGYDVPR